VSCVRFERKGAVDVLAAPLAPAVGTSRRGVDSDTPVLEIHHDAAGNTFCAGALSVRLASPADCTRMCGVLRQKLEGEGSQEQTFPVAVTLELCKHRLGRHTGSTGTGTPQLMSKFVLVLLDTEHPSPVSGTWMNHLRQCMLTSQAANPYQPFNACALTVFLKVGLLLFAPAHATIRRMCCVRTTTCACGGGC